MTSTVTVRFVTSRCGCDEWVMCEQHEQANDTVVAGQDAYTRMMDEAGLTRLARHQRHERARTDVGALDRALERYEIFSALQCERPITCPVDPMSRRWDRTRVSKAAPADSLLTVSPVSVTDRTKREW